MLLTLNRDRLRILRHRSSFYLRSACATAYNSFGTKTRNFWERKTLVDPWHYFMLETDRYEVTDETDGDHRHGPGPSAKHPLNTGSSSKVSIRLVAWVFRVLTITTKIFYL